MTFRLTPFRATNRNAPRQTGRSCVDQPGKRVQMSGQLTTANLHTDCRNARGVPYAPRLFTQSSRGLGPSREDFSWIMPRLRPGCRIPSAAWMGRFLHISAGEGARHMRRVLAEAGIQTETRGAWRDRRVYVVAVGRVAP